MPKQNLFITVTDNYSSKVGNMIDVTKAFNKTLEDQHKQIDEILKSNDKLTPDAIYSLKEIDSNSSNSTATALYANLIENDAIQIIQENVSSSWGNRAGSCSGSDAETVATNAGNGLVAGASAGFVIGSMLPIPVLGAAIGIAVGSVLGTILGTLNGEIKNKSKRDDAFKDIVASEYERITLQQDAMLQSGIAIAAERERQKPFDGLDSNGLVKPTEMSYLTMLETVNGLQDNISASAGQGFIDERKIGLEKQADWLSGPQGQKMAEGNELIGQYKAKLENDREQALRDAQTKAMDSAEYKKALNEGNGAEAGRILMEAQVKAENEYKKSDGYQLYLETEKTMVTDLRANLSEGWENFGYTMGQQFTYGLERGRTDARVILGEADDWITYSKANRPEYYKQYSNSADSFRQWSKDNRPEYYGAAFGMNYVPYDNFPALLHQGERVLTASQARAADHVGNRPPITITGNTFHVREEADIGRIAAELANKLEKARVTYVG